MKPIYLLFTIPATLLIIFTPRITHSLFTSSASNSGNSFSAATVFNTPTPSIMLEPTIQPITPTLTPTSTPIPTTNPSPTPTLANHIVISEIQLTEGTGVSNHDFVELYNPTSSNFDLNGYRLVYRTSSGTTDNSIKSWTSTTIIPPLSFYLWANSSIAGSVGADVSTSASIADNNSIALRQGAEDTGTIIDAVNWSSNINALSEGSPITITLAANQSLERKAYSTSTVSTMASGGDDELKGNGFDSDNNTTDFIIRPLSQPQNSLSPSETP